jgi:hypothetical protein
MGVKTPLESKRSKVVKGSPGTVPHEERMKGQDSVDSTAERFQGNDLLKGRHWKIPGYVL